MKILYNHPFKGLLLILFMLPFLAGNAQRRFALLAATSGPSAYIYSIQNDVQISDRIIEFDLYLLDADATQPFELANIQAGITVNPLIFNGGTATMSIIPGTSELLAPGGGASSLQPTSVTITMAQNAIKLAPKTPPGTGSGPIISTTGFGTRICRLRMTNSVAFTANSTVDYTFNFTTNPYATKVFQYVGGLNIQVGDLTNCISNAANKALNKNIISETLTGGGSYCAGDAGVNIGLTSSIIGVTYTLYKDGVAQTPTVAGTNAAISFGPQLAGSYTVKGSYVNGVNVWGTVDMTGTAAITATPALTINSQSTATQSKIIGETFNPISVNASGSNLTYQWFSNTSPNTSGGTSLGSSNGAQTDSYIPQAVTEGTLYYYCEIISTCGTKKSNISEAFIVTNAFNLGTDVIDQSKSEVKVYSTTTSKNVHLNFDQASKAEVVSMEGVVLQSKNIENLNELVFNLNGYSHGVYLIKLTFKDKSTVVKRVILH